MYTMDPEMAERSPKWQSLVQYLTEGRTGKLWGSDKVVVAGGALRWGLTDNVDKNPLKDVDVFLLKGADLNAILSQWPLCWPGDPSFEVLVSRVLTRGITTVEVPCGITEGGTISIQFIQTGFETMEELLKDFDFRCCQMGWDGEKVVVAEGALRDAAIGLLTVTAHHTPVGTLNRLVRFVKRGYAVDGGSLAVMLEKSGLLDEENPLYGGVTVEPQAVVTKDMTLPELDGIEDVF